MMWRQHGPRDGSPSLLHRRRRSVQALGLVLGLAALLGCEEDRPSETSVVEAKRQALTAVFEKLESIDVDALTDRPLAPLQGPPVPVCNFGQEVQGESVGLHAQVLPALGRFRTRDVGIGNNRSLATAYLAIREGKVLASGGTTRALHQEPPTRANVGEVSSLETTLDQVATLRFALIINTTEFTPPPEAAPIPEDDGHGHGGAAHEAETPEFEGGRIAMAVRAWDLQENRYLGGFSAWARNSEAAARIRGEHFSAMIARDLSTNAVAALQNACIAWGGQAP